MKLPITFVFLINACFFVHAQQLDWDKLQKQYPNSYIITKPNEQIELDTLVLFPPPKFKTYYDKRYYQWFKKKTYNAYPYAVLAKEKINFLNDTIQQIKSKRKQRKFVKEKQDFFEKQFAENVKKLTKTEGRILIKLIHRLTGATVHEHIKDKRGNFKAFWYRFSASFFKIHLDAEYHPESVMEDYMIESILQHAFSKGDLPKHASVLKSGNMLFPRRVIEVKKKK